MAHAAQLAGIAIERRLSEEALRSSEAKYRGLFENITEGVYQSSRDGRFLSVNPALVRLLGYDTAEEIYALPSAALIYWNPNDRAELRPAHRSRRRSPQRRVPDPPPRRSAGRSPGERARNPRCRTAR